MAYTFSGKCFVTRGVSDNFSIELQLSLFAAIERMREKVGGELDYLQIFRIVSEKKGNKKFLHIYHEQECPEAKLKYIVPTEKEVSGKAYMIDDLDHVTLLLAEEY